MKKRLEKWMKLCLITTLLVAAAFCSIGNNSARAWAATDPGAGSAGGFVVTRYVVEGNKTITKGSETTINLNIKHTTATTPDEAVAEVSRLVDSFSGSGTITAVVVSSVGSPLELNLSISGLKYSGSGKSLRFMVKAGSTYEQMEVTIAECKEYEDVPYEPPVPETPDPSPAPMVLISRSEMSSTLKAKEIRSITIYVKNVGTTTMKSPILNITPSDSLILPGASQMFQLKDIAAGKTESVTIAVQALDTISSANQYLDMEVKFQYFNRVSTVDGAGSGKVTIPCKVKETKDPEEPATDSPVPNLIISGFDYGGASVAAGADFNLQFKVTNTSKSLKAENVVVTLTGGEGFTINGASNTFYFEKISAGKSKTVSVPMKVLNNVTTGANPVSVTFKYEYVDNKKRVPTTSEVTMTVPVYQPDRFEISRPTVPVTVYAGEENSVTMNYVNKSKSEISNVEAVLEGNVETYTPVQNVGNLEPGKSGTIVFAVTAYEVGETDFTIKVTYEDGNGEAKTREYPVTMTVEEMIYEDPGMIDPMPEPEPEESKTNWFLIVGLIVAAILIAVVIIRKKKKAAALKKEAALWENWGNDFPEDSEVPKERESK